jgi:hypothetical protein
MVRWQGSQDGSVYLGLHHDNLTQEPGRPRPKHELSAAADVLVAMSNNPSSNVPTAMLPAEQVGSLLSAA